MAMGEGGVGDGGPAFPFGQKVIERSYGLSPNVIEENEPGMTLRDYFAAKAMQAYIGYITTNDTILSRIHAEVAAESYAIADALLAARGRS